MKKQILLLYLFFISTCLVAQTAPGIGVRGGISYGGLKGESMDNLHSMLDFSNDMITTTDHTGFFAGPYISIPIDENITIEPAVYYNQKGYNITGGFTFKGIQLLNAKASLTTNYIDLPILFKANFDGLEVFAGPQLSYLMQADMRATAGILGFNLLKQKTNVTAQFNRYDMGLSGGLGYNFSNGINIMASYDYGLSKVDANKNLQSYNRFFKVGIGVSF